MTRDEIRRANSITDSDLVNYLDSLRFEQAAHAIADCIPAKTHSYLYETLFAVHQSVNHMTLHLQSEYLDSLAKYSPIESSSFLLDAAHVLLDQGPADLRLWATALTECFIAHVPDEPQELDVDGLLPSESDFAPSVDASYATATYAPTIEPVKVDKQKEKPYVPTKQSTPSHRLGSAAAAQATIRANRWHKTHHKSADQLRQYIELYGSTPELQAGDWQYMELCPACRSMQKNKPHSSFHEFWHFNEVHAPCQAIAWDISYPNIKKVFGGFHYVSHFVDIVSYHKWVFFLKRLTVDEVLAAVLYVVNVIKLEFNTNVRVLLSDAFSSFKEKNKMLRFKLDLGIETYCFPRYDHHQNPAEAVIRENTRGAVVNLQQLRLHQGLSPSLGIRFWAPFAFLHKVQADSICVNDHIRRVFHHVNTPRNFILRRETEDLKLHPFGERIMINLPDSMRAQQDMGDSNHSSPKMVPTSVSGLYLASAHYAPFVDMYTATQESIVLPLNGRNKPMITYNFTVDSDDPNVRRMEIKRLQAKYDPNADEPEPTDIDIDDERAVLNDPDAGFTPHVDSKIDDDPETSFDDTDNLPDTTEDVSDDSAKVSSKATESNDNASEQKSSPTEHGIHDAVQDSKLHSAPTSVLDEQCVIQQNNPKRVGSKSHERYEKYKAARSYTEFIELGGLHGDWVYDRNKGFISISSSQPFSSDTQELDLDDDSTS
ncbi:MAG: hypothetical protein AAFV95_29065, partial [Bacteroidota bacterium]